MKRRLLALLLAGIMTASMASCVTSKGNGTPTGTETNPPKQDQTDPADTVTWQEVNQTVYVTASSMTLIGVDNASDVVSVAQVDKLQRVKIGSNGKSIVVKNDKQYYADTVGLTDIDLLGESFVACEPTTMYVSDNGVSIRKYAARQTQISFSTTIAVKNINDEVEVIAKGAGWYKINYDNNQYFISSDYVVAERVENPNDPSLYPAFTDLPTNERYTLYVVNTESLRLRKYPSGHQSTEIVAYLTKGTAVTVVAKKTIEGDKWIKVTVAQEVEGGQSAGNLVGYLYEESSYLSASSTDSTAATLEDMLREYTAFTKLENAQTMYVLAKSAVLTIRSTPRFPAEGEDSNIVGAFNAKTETTEADAIKVVATGTADDTLWAMVEYDEGEYYFVSYKHLTVNADGTPTPLTLTQLLALHPMFTELQTPKAATAAGAVNCNTAPKNDTDVKKTLAAGDAVTIVAEGEVNYVKWYIFQTADSTTEYYFASANMFTLTSAT